MRGFLLPILIAGIAAAQSRRSPDAPRSASPSLAGDMIAAHNAVRARVGTRPLVWSGELAAYAREWAETLLKNDEFAHRRNSKYGENLFLISGAAATPAQVVETWAAEARNYDYNSNRCSAMCGHYTQIVWNDTSEVGCAVARGGNREIWVCNYDPPGNWVGKRPY